MYSSYLNCLAVSVVKSTNIYNFMLGLDYQPYCQVSYIAAKLKI